MLWGLGSMRQIGDEEALANWRDYFVFTVRVAAHAWAGACAVMVLCPRGRR